jgi:hypothetical protein
VAAAASVSGPQGSLAAAAGPQASGASYGGGLNRLAYYHAVAGPYASVAAAMLVV